MKWMRGMFLAVFTSAILAFVLSFLPSVELNQLKVDEGVSAFNTAEELTVLSENNIPDVMLSKNYHSRLTKLQWKYPLLSVDFHLNPQRHNAARIYDDLYQAIELGLRDTKNVEDVLIRVYVVGQTGEPKLGMTVVAKRSQISNDFWGKRKGSLEVREALENTFNLKYKSAWEYLSDK